MLRRFCTLEALAVLLPGLCWRCAPDAPATRAVDAAPGAAGNNAEPAALPGEPAAQPGVSETPAQAAEGPAAPSLALPGAMAGVLDAGPAADAGAPSGTSDRCNVGVLDPAQPPRSLQLSGNLGAHDPVILAAGGLYRYFSTGDGISVKTSTDLLRWTQQPEVFPSTPAWFQQSVPAYEPRNIWAPDLSYFGGQYHLYYSVSSFGSNRSCIGHATRADLDAGSWSDHGAVLCSNQPGQNDDFNAIDPNVILDEAGTPWLAFGSFWSGIQLAQLDLEGRRSGTQLYPLASRGGGAIEGPFLVRRCGYYYLFVSFDACCRGADSTYNLRVGRSRELLGPYLDRAGKALLQGGGTLLLSGDADWAGPGHNAVLFDGSRAFNVYHAYATTNGASQLRIAELAWDAEGWPVSGGP
jgi:arabinan endo-1,5-alpha-L-arabinosidase